MPDTTSPIYPGRPIHPRPKKSLRSRLSPEQAESILYPPLPINSKTLFYPFKETARHINGTRSNVVPNRMNGQAEHTTGGHCGDNKDSYEFKGIEQESDEEDGIGIIRRYQEQRHVGNTAYRGFTNGGAQAEIAKYPKSTNIQPMTTSADLVDGYDSFENTNNKKKRKIPTSGGPGNHHTSLSADMAQMGLSSPRDLDTGQVDSDGGVSQYYGSGNSAVPAGNAGTGISGAGRGRFGRSGARIGSGRSPLGVSTNGSNAVHSARSALQSRANGLAGGVNNKDSRNTPDQGIISAAIANAAASPSTPSKGQENVSLLEQQSSKVPSSSKTQFTFTCESDSSRGMAWSNQQSPSPAGLHQASAPVAGVPAPPNPMLPPQGGVNQQSQRGFSTQGTQTSPTMANQPQATGQPRRPRRSPAKQAAISARQRRMQQEVKNYHHPPSKDETWICQFCEYESIFGAPPEALIRQYEIKDRQERRRLAEKRRLLEKAKMKGKKGKKGNKNAAKNANAATQPQSSTQSAQYDQQQPDQAPVQHQGTQNEESLTDDYDYKQHAIPPASPSKIPQPVVQHNHPRTTVGEVGPHAGRAPAGRVS